MNATVSGTPGGVQSGDVITKIEIVWKSGAETEAQAMTAGRGVILTAAGDITAFQSGTYTLSSAYLVSGQTYTPAVRVTESRSGVDGFVGGWTSGGSFTAPPQGLLDFETAGLLTPFGLTGAYVIINASYAVRSSTKAHTGAYSMAFTQANGAAGMSRGSLDRQITLPSDGTVTFKRWFLCSVMNSGSSGPNNFALFLLSLGNDLNNYATDSGINVTLDPGASGAGVFAYTGAWETSIKYAVTSMSANTWYEAVLTITMSSGVATGATLALYANNSGVEGAQLLAPTSVPIINTINAGTRYIVAGAGGGSGTATLYMDDFLDGI